MRPTLENCGKTIEHLPAIGAVTKAENIHVEIYIDEKGFMIFKEVIKWTK